MLPGSSRCTLKFHSYMVEVLLSCGPVVEAGAGNRPNPGARREIRRRSASRRAKLFASFAVTRVPLNGAFFASELPEVTVLKL